MELMTKLANRVVNMCEFRFMFSRFNVLMFPSAVSFDSEQRVKQMNGHRSIFIASQVQEAFPVRWTCLS